MNMPEDVFYSFLRIRDIDIEHTNDEKGLEAAPSKTPAALHRQCNSSFKVYTLNLVDRHDGDPLHLSNKRREHCRRTICVNDRVSAENTLTCVASWFNGRPFHNVRG